MNKPTISGLIEHLSLLVEVENHLRGCPECATILRILVAAEKVNKSDTMAYLNGDTTKPFSRYDVDKGLRTIVKSLPGE